MIIDLTITTLFMVPPLKIPAEHLTDNNFINAYSYDPNSEYENCIFLLFRPQNIHKFRMFLDSEYERCKLLIADYDYSNGYVVLVYKLNDEFKEDYDLIRKGLYSKTSKVYQNQISKVKKVVVNGLRRDELSLQYRIFVKSNDLIEFWEDKFGITFQPEYEVWEGFREENETLDLLKIKEYDFK